MKNNIIKLVGLLAMLGLVGCASSGSTSMPKAETTKQFRFEAVNFKFDQLITPDIAYHTPEELEKMLNEKIASLLKEKGLFSQQEDMNKLNITASYQRRFGGDGTPIPSDALAYPRYSYKIVVQDGTKTIRSVEKDGLIYSGGMVMDLQVIALALRDKKYEIEFVDAFANTIVEQIEEL